MAKVLIITRDQIHAVIEVPDTQGELLILTTKPTTRKTKHKGEEIIQPIERRYRVTHYLPVFEEQP